MKFILKVFLKMTVWVADTHGDLGGLLCFLTAVVGVTACYMDFLIVAITLTPILIIYFLMIILYGTMSRVDRERAKG